MARDAFDATLRDVRKVVPNGSLYAGLRAGDPITTIEADSGAFLDSKRLRALVALSGHATVEALPSLPDTADARLPIELTMLLVATSDRVPDGAFARLLERQIVESVARCEDENAPVARELSVLLHQFHGMGTAPDGERQRHHLLQEVSITTRHMTHWPNLVGASVVRYGRWLLADGDRTRAAEMFGKVILDLAYLVGRIDDEALPTAERMTALWWLAEAHTGRAAAEPTNAEHANEAASIRELLAVRGIREVPTGVRVGVLAGAYRSEDERLAPVVARMMETSTDPRRLLIELVHEHGVPSRQVDACRSAIASFPVRRMLTGAGVGTVHGDEEERVFRILEARETR